MRRGNGARRFPGIRCFPRRTGPCKLPTGIITHPLTESAMARTETPVCEFGQTAPDFSLPGTDGKMHTLQGERGPNGLLVMFICNHCPYVQSVRDRIIRGARALHGLGIHTVAIMSNDPGDYPEDSFDNTQKIAT